MSDLKMAREALPEMLPGHWATPEGQRMAREYTSKSRADLAMGDRPDFALANAVFMAGRADLDLINYQTAAKERIRWLSVQLALAEAALSTLNSTPPAPQTSEEVEAVRAALEKAADTFEHIVEYWNKDQNETAMADALWHMINTASLAASEAREALATLSRGEAADDPSNAHYASKSVIADLSTPIHEAAAPSREAIAKVLALHGLGTVSGANTRSPPNASWAQEEWERRILECVPGHVEQQCFDVADAIRALWPEEHVGGVGVGWRLIDDDVLYIRGALLHAKTRVEQIIGPGSLLCHLIEALARIKPVGATSSGWPKASKPPKDVRELIAELDASPAHPEVAEMPGRSNND